MSTKVVNVISFNSIKGHSSKVTQKSILGLDLQTIAKFKVNLSTLLKSKN